LSYARNVYVTDTFYSLLDYHRESASQRDLHEA
jgi:hypothetical protein